MRTAVQLRTGDLLRCELLHGEPSTLSAAALGPVALFEADRIVAYKVASRRRLNLFVFRTLVVDDRMAAAVPGVHPRVRLLIHAQAAGAIEQLRRLFAHVAKQGLEAARLPDVFYRRVGHAVCRRRPTQAPLRGLLRVEVGGGSLGELAPRRNRP